MSSNWGCRKTSIWSWCTPWRVLPAVYNCPHPHSLTRGRSGARESDPAHTRGTASSPCAAVLGVNCQHFRGFGHVQPTLCTRRSPVFCCLVHPPPPPLAALDPARRPIQGIMKTAQEATFSAPKQRSRKTYLRIRNTPIISEVQSVYPRPIPPKPLRFSETSVGPSPKPSQAPRGLGGAVHTSAAPMTFLCFLPSCAHCRLRPREVWTLTAHNLLTCYWTPKRCYAPLVSCQRHIPHVFGPRERSQMPQSTIPSCPCSPSPSNLLPVSGDCRLSHHNRSKYRALQTQSRVFSAQHPAD